MGSDWHERAAQMHELAKAARGSIRRMLMQIAAEFEQLAERAPRAPQDARSGPTLPE
jgi:hypothetical protein